MDIEKKKSTLKNLLLLISVGVLLDGVSTIVGNAVGIQEGNPIAALIGLEASLLIRVGCIISLYVIVLAASEPSEIKKLVWIYSVFALVIWSTVFFNAAFIMLYLWV